MLTKGVNYIGISVVFFCHDGQGNVLMGRRSRSARDEHGRWDIGGGGLEFGETVERALRREIKEEYCTDVVSYEVLGFRDVHRVHQGKITHWVALDFKVLIDKNKVANGDPEKIAEIGWFLLNTIPKDSHSQFPEFLQLYKDKL